MHGAIDLGARQAAARKQQERRTQGGGPAPAAAAAGGPYVVDVTDETFNTEVVDRSQSVPVLVDFWAEWCGPCKQLGPILEKLATEAAGKWILAKVDIDANPQLGAYMQQMGVRGIPFVAAVVGGQLLPFLNGAAPEPQVRQAIDQLFEALREQGILPDAPEGEQQPADAADVPAEDPVYAQAEDALQRGDLDAAKAAFERILAADPRDGQAKQGLALVQLSLRVRSLDAERVLQEASEKPGDVQAQVSASDVEMVTGRIDDAFDRLLGAVRRSAGDDRDAVRKHLLSLFELLPPDDPRVAKARRGLQSALF
ncbi:tetratricopeptide repeat protein [Actinomadura darangshiensis]|uniref:Tetratricopeptide repeat protein n=1 Tax=Actinomadura darangshiensis TaxID=705336 RepID=A0A4R5AYF7_9ACTN|nr:tetratricopeptide repeat protein [Actinomadura darangshiensis]TDD77655.1 tetratricopeptide repeat protein [Actinomadura darangshiensis]